MLDYRTKTKKPLRKERYIYFLFLLKVALVVSFSDICMPGFRKCVQIDTGFKEEESLSKSHKQAHSIAKFSKKRQIPHLNSAPKNFPLKL